MGRGELAKKESREGEAKAAAEEAKGDSARPLPFSPPPGVSGAVGAGLKGEVEVPSLRALRTLFCTPPRADPSTLETRGFSLRRKGEAERGRSEG